jgi:hypothetical protein
MAEKPNQPAVMALEQIAIREKTRKSFIFGSLPNETVEALRQSRMAERHSALNVLMLD